MGVSRPTVRAAINKLVDRGLLEHRQGQGTFVRLPPSAQDNNPLKLMLDGHEATLVELLEVRLGLECNAAALAARRATEEDVRLIEKSLIAMRENVERGGLAFEEDAHFHMCIAYASKNPVQIHIMKHLYDLLRYGIRENLAHLYQSPANIEEVMAQHEKVLDSIRRHDTDAAFQSMLHHINFVVDFFAGKQLPAA
jgi:GntR family transcriptional repressor for pyruvate dehydrogenase complex